MMKKKNKLTIKAQMSLGYLSTKGPPPPQPRGLALTTIAPPTEEVIVEVSAPKPIAKAYKALSLGLRVSTSLFYGVSLVVAVATYFMPVETVELVTTIDVAATKSAIVSLAPLMANVPNLPDLLLLDVNYFETVLTLFVQLMSCLILCLSAALVMTGPATQLTRCAAIVSLAISTGYAIAITVEDGGDILETWFPITFLIVCCGIPLATLTGMALIVQCCIK